MNWIRVPRHKRHTLEWEKFWADYAKEIFRPGTILKLKNGKVVLVGHDQTFESYTFGGQDIIAFNPNLIRPMSIIIKELEQC